MQRCRWLLKWGMKSPLIAGPVVIEKIFGYRESGNYLLIPSANGLYRDHILSIDFRNRDASGDITFRYHHEYR